MGNKVLDWSDLDEAFKLIAAAEPGKKSQCRYYAWNSEEKIAAPCCAVATVLHKFDITVPVKMEDDQPNGVIPVIQNFFIEADFADRFTVAGRQYLMALQYHQDDDQNWSYARHKAAVQAERFARYAN